jgi:hypothetical protein
MLACRGSGWDRGAASDSAADVDVGFNRGVAAGIDDLAGVDSGDLGGHDRFILLE